MSAEQQSVLGVNGALDEEQAQKPRGKAAAPAPVSSERKFEVLETCEVPRGHHKFQLHRGQQVSSHGYDLEELRRAGVKLREIK
jgi:hypothetical protein